MLKALSKSLLISFLLISLFIVKESGVYAKALSQAAEKSGSLDAIQYEQQSLFIRINGWAADNYPVTKIEIFRDTASTPASITFNLPRPDVAIALNQPTWTNSGWEATISLDQLPLGQHKLTAYAINANGDRWKLPNQPGTETITIVPGPFRPTPASIASYIVAILFGMFMMGIVKYVRRK